MKKRIPLVVSILALTAATAAAKGSSNTQAIVDAMFTDNMVLQRDVEIPVWGNADPNETVVVEYVPHPDAGQAPQKVSAQADGSGAWRLTLKPLPASGKGGRLIITGDKRGASIERKDVLVGEVWVGSGQSNMAYGTRHFTLYDPDLKKACEGGPYPMLRVYVGSTWQVADTNSIHDFSALLFSYGHALQQELGVPVGLMCGAVNGSPSGSWLTEEMAGASPAFFRMFTDKSGFKSFEEMREDRAKRKAAYTAEVKKAKAEGKKPPRFVQGATIIGEHYTKRIQPFVPYAIRGALWDQGESGTGVPGVDQYTVMDALITGWRKAWGRGDFPFLHIQKPSGGGCSWDDTYPEGRKAPLQWVPLPEEPLPDDRGCTHNLKHIRMGALTNAPLVTTSDLTPGIHPQAKYDYGKRACRVALGTVYGRDIVTCGPVYTSHTVRPQEIEVFFSNVGKGLTFRHGDKLQGFEIAGEDLKWEWAEARIDGARVIVSSGKISAPRHVRYAFNRIFNWANLFNKDGLPALMFTTAHR